MKKRRDIRNFYVNEDFIPFYEKYIEIMKRENSSVSEGIRDLIKSYVRLHEPGNPQQRLDVILIDKKAYRAPVFCGFRGCNGEADGYGVYVPSGQRLPLCGVHYRFACESSALWKVEKTK